MTDQDSLALGISLYLSEPEADSFARLGRSRDRGVTAAFTSLHIPEEEGLERQPRRLRRMAEEARDTGISLVADISPVTLRRLGLPGDDDAKRVIALSAWGLGGVRFDDGFTMETVAAVSHEMRVQLNASTITQADLEDLHRNGADFSRVEALHNFYPRRDTGLSLATFGWMNARLRGEGLRIGAFAPGDGALRGPLFEGLPTCEDHRGADPVASAVALWRGPAPSQGADAVYVGDIDLAAGTWDRWQILAQGSVPVRWEVQARDPLEREVADLLSSQSATNRPDAAERVIRLRDFRPAIGQPSPLSPSGRSMRKDTPGAGQARPRGAVTVDNAGYGRYAGEVQIALVDLPADPRVTVIGQVLETDKALLGHIPGGGRLRLITAEG